MAGAGRGAPARRAGLLALIQLHAACLPAACLAPAACPPCPPCRRTNARRSGGYRRWVWRPAALTAARRCRCPGGGCATPSSGARQAGRLAGWQATRCSCSCCGCPPACPPACDLGACYGSDHMVTRLPHPCPNLPACLIAQCRQRGARRRVCARLWLHWRQCHAGGGGGDGSQGAGHGLIPCAGLLLAADCCWQSGPQADARRRSIARPASHATCLSCWRYLCCCCHPCSYAQV